MTSSREKERKDAADEMAVVIRIWFDCPADKRPSPHALGKRIEEIAAAALRDEQKP